MATPHVAGLAALLWQAKPTATANDVESAIYASCELGTLPKGRANRGVPDAVRAVEQLTGRPLPAAAARAASVRRKKVAKNKKGRSAYRAAPKKRKDKRRRAKR
jgi:subtilisin family serine protease